VCVPAAPLRVLVLEDDDAQRAAVLGHLQQNASVDLVAAAATLAQARQAVDHSVATARPVELAVLDIRVPDGSGLQFCRELRSIYPAARCIVLTDVDSADFRLAAAIVGADAFVPKTTCYDGLMEAVFAIAAGQRPLQRQAEYAQQVLYRSDAASSFGPLTQREQAVRDLLLGGSTDREIAAALGVFEHTVRADLSSLVTKAISVSAALPPKRR